jgi:hypothetical protein
MSAKFAVKGKNIHPLYEILTEKGTHPRFAGMIAWTFNKFLIDRKGNVIDRFDSKAEPMGGKDPPRGGERSGSIGSPNCTVFAGSEITERSMARDAASALPRRRRSLYLSRADRRPRSC